MRTKREARTHGGRPRNSRELRKIDRRREDRGIPAPVRRQSLGAPTADEVRRVRQMRREGQTYVEIDKAMGWPDAHGGRTWYLLNVPTAYRSGRKVQRHR